MKYIYIISFVLMYCQYGTAQDKKPDLVIADFLSVNAQYFQSAVIRENGVLEIQAKEAYSAMEVNKKNVVLEMALKNWDGEMLFVHCGYKREIWRKEAKTGSVSLIGLWDLNNPEIHKYLPAMLQTTKIHPWFFYVGGQAYFNSDIFNAMLNARVGSFLLKDRWDLALALSAGGNDNDMTSIVSFDIGVNSKVYYPIKKYNISPYIGAGLSYAISNSKINLGTESIDTNSSYWRKALLLGVSWYVGPGSLDLGVQLGDNFNLNIGYTFAF